MKFLKYSGVSRLVTVARDWGRPPTASDIPESISKVRPTLSAPVWGSIEVTNNWLGFRFISCRAANQNGFLASSIESECSQETVREVEKSGSLGWCWAWSRNLCGPKTCWFVNVAQYRGTIDNPDLEAQPPTDFLVWWASFMNLSAVGSGSIQAWSALFSKILSCVFCLEWHGTLNCSFSSRQLS